MDKSFYRMIAVWESWYKGKVRNFTFYRVYSGQGTYSRKQRKSLGMAKKLSEDIADLLLNERVRWLSQMSLREYSWRKSYSRIISGTGKRLPGTKSIFRNSSVNLPICMMQKQMEKAESCLELERLGLTM